MKTTNFKSSNWNPQFSKSTIIEIRGFHKSPKRKTVHLPRMMTPEFTIHPKTKLLHLEFDCYRITWLIMKIFGIFLLSFLWFAKTTMTVKFAMIPTHAMTLWIMTIKCGVTSAFADEEMFLISVQFKICIVTLFSNALTMDSFWHSVFSMFE